MIHHQTQTDHYCKGIPREEASKDIGDDADSKCPKIRLVSKSIDGAKNSMN
jgi:hypothetical protein